MALAVISNKLNWYSGAFPTLVYELIHRHETWPQPCPDLRPDLFSQPKKTRWRGIMHIESLLIGECRSRAPEHTST